MTKIVFLNLIFILNINNLPKQDCCKSQKYQESQDVGGGCYEYGSGRGRVFAEFFHYQGDDSAEESGNDQIVYHCKRQNQADLPIIVFYIYDTNNDYAID